MNSKQAMEFQKEFVTLLNKHEVGTHLMFALIEEQNDIQGMFFGSVQDKDAQRAAITAQGVIQNLLSFLALHNGLGPHAAAGALKGMVDAALDDTLEVIYSPPEHPNLPPEAEA